MSALKMAATVIWTQLCNALIEDGMMAPLIQQSGPKTTAFVVQLAQDNVMKESAMTWVPAAIAPNHKVEVFGIDMANPKWPGDIVYFNKQVNLWITRSGQVAPRISHYLVIPPREGQEMQA